MSSQDNLALRIDDAAVAGAFAAEFDEMWSGVFKQASPPTPVTDFSVTGDFLRVLFGADDDPIGDTTKGLRSFVQAATESILYSIYAFTGTVGDPFAGLEDDLVARWNAGVNVRGVFDTDFNASSTPYTDMNSLQMDVRLDGNSDLLHTKLMVVDQQLLVVGSANFTYSADAWNDENLVYFANASAARRALKYMQWLHSQATDESPLASPAPDLTAPAPIEGVSLADGPGSGTLTVDWTAGSEADLSRYHVFVWTAAISDADLDYDSPLDPVATVLASGSGPLDITVDSTDSPIQDGTDYWAAVVATDTSANESSLSSGSVAGPVTALSGPPGEAGAGGTYEMLRARPGSSPGQIEVAFANACGATGQGIYWSDQSFPLSASDWNRAGCGFVDGDSDDRTFNVSITPSSSASLVYFVVVGHDGLEEGSYGKDSSGVERPAATAAARCQAQNLVGNCL